MSATTIHANHDTFSSSSAIKDYGNVNVKKYGFQCRCDSDNDIAVQLTIDFLVYFDVIDHAKLLAFFEVVRGGSWLAKNEDIA